jgi:hypothetical protein
MASFIMTSSVPSIQSTSLLSPRTQRSSSISRASRLFELVA